MFQIVSIFSTTKVPFLIALTGKHHGLSLRSSIDHRRVVLERLKWVNQWLEDKLPLGQHIICIQLFSGAKC